MFPRLDQKLRKSRVAIKLKIEVNTEEKGRPDGCEKDEMGIIMG